MSPNLVSAITGEGSPGRLTPRWRVGKTEQLGSEILGAPCSQLSPSHSVKMVSPPGYQFSPATKLPWSQFNVLTCDGFFSENISESKCVELPERKPILQQCVQQFNSVITQS